MAQKFKLRSFITATPGNLLVAADLSQAETWVVAFKANEPRMKYALQYSDIHTQTAGSAIFFRDISCDHVWDKETRTCIHCASKVTTEMRYIGKRWNHASSYRMGPDRAAEVVNKDSDQPPYVTITVSEARKFSGGWHDYYNLKGWWYEIEEKLNRDRTITTVYRRTRTFYGQWGPELFKEATAYEPQSTVADHFNGAIQPELGISGGLLGIYRKIVKPSNGSIRIINQSHDSCMLDVPRQYASSTLEEMMNLLRRPLIINGEQFTIPVDGEIGERWGELEKAA